VASSDPLGPDLEPLDFDRFEYEVVHTLGSADPIFIQGPCKHRPQSLEPVLSGGQEVAVLCVDCDLQLPAGWR